jgi:hypothetical protein
MKPAPPVMSARIEPLCCEAMVNARRPEDSGNGRYSKEKRPLRQTHVLIYVLSSKSHERG